MGDGELRMGLPHKSLLSRKLTVLVDGDVEIFVAFELGQVFGSVKQRLFFPGRDVDEVKGPRVSLERCANPCEQLPEQHLGARVEKEEDGGFSGQLEFEEILANGFDVGTAQEVSRISLEVALCDCVKFWGEFDSDHATKREVGGQE